MAVFVDKEAPVSVAVERQADVRAFSDDRLLQVTQVLRLDRVGLMVGEGAVKLEIERGQLDRQAVEHHRDGVSGHAVPGVRNDLETAIAGEVHQRVQVGRVLLQHVLADDLSTPGFRGWNVTCFQPRADLPKAAVLTDGGSTRTAQLDSVVPCGVVTGRDYRPREIEAAAGIVEKIGGP